MAHAHPGLHCTPIVRPIDLLGHLATSCRLTGSFDIHFRHFQHWNSLNNQVDLTRDWPGGAGLGMLCPPMRTQYDQNDIDRLLAKLADAIAREFDPRQPLNVIGVLTRGQTLASRLTRLLSMRGFGQINRGVLDIGLYRDDLADSGRVPHVRPSELNMIMDNLPVLLVDDVLFTGRTIRAALNALADFGRPSVVRLAVLVDRNGRELPIQADFAALRLSDIPSDYRVNVHMMEIDGRDDIVVESK